MNILQRIALLLLLAVAAAPLAAQNMKTADKAFNSEEYVKAVAEYKAVEPTLHGLDQSFVQYRIGECYRRMNKPEQAVEWYAKAEKNGCKKPEMLYAYGDMLTVLGRYSDARAYFQRYRKLNPEDDRVGYKLSSVEFALAYPKVNPHFTLKPVETVNTTGSEYGIAYMNNQLVYASTGDVTPSTSKSNISMRTGLGYSKIYVADPMEEAKFRRGVEMSSFNMDRSNDGTFSFDQNTKTAYYTRCEPSENQCYIYFSELVNGKWKEKGRLKIDSKILQIAHPCVSPNGERIYFSAMIEGGYGGSDIWYIEKGEKASWGKAINAGREINTPGNEVFPFVTDSVLFFSSDGRDGYGGLDVYASKISYGSHGKAVNLRPPFNTSYDDFNMIIHPNGNEGLLVSNRRNEKSSDDIFSFDGYPTVLIASGYVFDKETEVPMPGVSVMLTNENTGRMEDSITADDNGYYYAFLKPNTTYTFDIEHEGYEPQEKRLPTYSITFPMEFNLSSGYDMDFYLDKEKIIRNIAGRVYDKETGKPLANEPVYLYANGKKGAAKRTNAKGEYKFVNVSPEVLYEVKVENKDYFADAKELRIGENSKLTDYSKANGYDMDFALTKIQIGEEIEIDDIYYDLDKANLLPESKVELDKLITLIKGTPGIKLQISSHTDARGRDEYNKKLSDARAKSVVDYLIESGIDRKQLTWKGYGKTRLRIPNAKTEDEHRQNRRTTFKVLEVGATPPPDFESFTEAESVTLGGGKDTGSGSTASQVSQAQQPSTGTATDNVNYTVQISMAAKLDMTDPKLRKAESATGSKVWHQKGADGRYRYYIGKFRDRDQAADMVKQLKAAGLSDCFIKDLKR